MESKANRELRTTGTFNVPVSRMWEAWTDPGKIANWWGPEGFTTTILQMDFREGGDWKLTLHGPNGINYPNRSVYKEIIPLRKIVFEHFNPHFVTTVLFREEGANTQIDWILEFDTPEMREIIVKTHKADKGQEENMERLRTFLYGSSAE